MSDDTKQLLATGIKALPGETQEARYYRVTLLRTERLIESRRRNRDQGRQDPSGLCGGKHVCTPDNMRPISALCISDVTAVSAVYGAIGLDGRF
jgi:hypothetical protein